MKKTKKFNKLKQFIVMFWDDMNDECVKSFSVKEIDEFMAEDKVVKSIMGTKNEWLSTFPILVEEKAK